MLTENVAVRLIDKCDIYFEGSLISKERIIQKYVDFFASAVSKEEHSVSITLHTGSICFDIVSFLTATLGCLAADITTPEQIIEALNPGDMVMYKNERYRWVGIKTNSGAKYLVIEQDGRGKNGKSTHWLPFELNKSLIKPYSGTSTLTDGRGVRKSSSNRAEFISYILDVPKSDIPPISGVSTVIVAERNSFKRIADGLKIVYDNDKQIDLLDIVPASYFTDGEEEHQYGKNPAKAESVLKITGKVSVARNLVLDKHSNKVVGLMIMGTNAVANGGSELEDLLARKSLRFAHVSMDLDGGNTESILKGQDDALVFACTKEFLLQNSLPVQEKNVFTDELDRQIDNIVNNTVSTVVATGGYSWSDYKKVRESLYIIKRSGWSEDEKNQFVISAHSLLNLFTTAAFTMQMLENALESGSIITGVISPTEKIKSLWALADTAGDIDTHCLFVIELLENLYKDGLEHCDKYEQIKRIIELTTNKNIAIIVPKSYYVDTLLLDGIFKQTNVTIVTANRFDSTRNYDEIIAVGDFVGKRFDPLKCRAATDITILLYECETHWFNRRSKKAGKFDRELNSRLGIGEDGINTDDTVNDHEGFDVFEEYENELSEYIDGLNTFDIMRFAARATASVGGTPVAEICAIGKFSTGERILFSKFYKAVVYDVINETVSETDIGNLAAGDVLVFTKRDGYTRNMVDSIYETLQNTGKLSPEALDYAEKATYWKEALREYKDICNMSFRDIAKALQKLGSSLQEVTIRQWLIEESHIVGPREEDTLRQIAELTGDPYLLGDTHGYFEACRQVRSQRIRILELISKAIADKLAGHTPREGSELDIVYKNVENLSDTLELDNILILDEVITVPINLINKPIPELEVTA